MAASTFLPQVQSFRPTATTQSSYHLSMATVHPFDREATKPIGTPVGTPFSTPTGTSVLIRRLPLNTSEEALRLMVVWSKELVSVELLPVDQSEDAGFRSAVLKFQTNAGAQEAREMLHGRTNISNDADMIVEIIPSSPNSLSRRFPADNATAGPSSATSSNASSTQSSRQPSRFNGAFQSLERISPPLGSAYTSNELPNPETSTHYQSLFSPQSPIGNHLNDRQNRITGKTLIKNDAAEDDETRELLKDPVAYAENGASSQRRATAPQIPIGRMANLSLNTNAPGPSSLPAFGHPGMAPISAHSSTMSPLTMMNGAGPGMSYPMGSQHYGRHNFPPVNPADQNPPCNTLYVGNLPIDTSEEELKAMFSKQRGYKRLCFRTKQNGPMCFVEFEDISFATKALHELYGHPLHNSVKGGIRLSFSKNPLGVRSGQNTAQNNSGSLSGMNGGISGPGSGFTTASGPPPGLSAPPGLPMNRMYGGSSMASGGNNHYNHNSNGGYPNSSSSNNSPWNNSAYNTNLGSGSHSSMMAGASSNYPPAYMLGR